MMPFTDDDRPRPKICTNAVETDDYTGSSFNLLTPDLQVPESPGSSCYQSAHSTARITNATISSFGEHNDVYNDDDDDADDECSSISTTVSSLCSCTISTDSATTKKPHKGNDARWEAVRAFKDLRSSHFKRLRALESGSDGSVLFLVELRGAFSLFVMKVKDKMTSAANTFHDNEKEILQCFDHPFLPTLYAHFETQKVVSLVTEFCPGGDLQALQQRQTLNCFSEDDARFYAAEVLLALEYLHFLGIIYRNLRPENVMIREDGHIMLSNFTPSLQCAVCLTLANMGSCSSRDSGNWINRSCILETACLQPTCFSQQFLGVGKCKYKSRKTNSSIVYSQDSLPELIAEPTSVRSMSIVGDPEYLAPEMIRGDGHGSALDWWNFGIFLYELLHGKTPFKGSGGNETMFNVATEPLRFSESPSISPAARDLISALLVKEPQQRLGYRQGASEIKQHPFFETINWALIRCATPPEVPSAYQKKIITVGQVPLASNWGLLGIDMKPTGNYLQMDFF